MGLAPLEGTAGDAWRTVGIRPFPTAVLPEAALSHPSPRGVFRVAFRAVLGRWGSGDGPSRANYASRSLRRALLIPQVNPGSLYRCGKRS